MDLNLHQVIFRNIESELTWIYQNTVHLLVRWWCRCRQAIYDNQTKRAEFESRNGLFKSRP